MSSQKTVKRWYHGNSCEIARLLWTHLALNPTSNVTRHIRWVDRVCCVIIGSEVELVCRRPEENQRTT